MSDISDRALASWRVLIAKIDNLPKDGADLRTLRRMVRDSIEEGNARLKESEPKFRLTGRKVTKVREMTDDEVMEQGWDFRADLAVAIEFDNALTVFASRDAEGNGPGCLFGTWTHGDVYVTPEDGDA